MSVEIIYRDLGRIGYQEALDSQEELFGELMARKTRGETTTPQYLLFCEHPPVFTLGKSGSQNNLLVNEDDLGKKGIGFYRINRGGDITFHGPGQVVGYPIIDLANYSLGIKSYIELLERSVVTLLGSYGIKSGRLKGATGVWLDGDDPAQARKICAIGVRASRYITMHGFAFNVNTDLSYYSFINPCGFVDRGVTSMQKETGRTFDMEAVKTRLKEILLGSLNQLTG